MKNPSHMWKYWRDKKGLKEALRDYYPDVVATDMRVAIALAQIEAAELVIDAVFSERAENEGSGE